AIAIGAVKPKVVWPLKRGGPPERWWNLWTPERKWRPLRKTRRRNRSPTMPSAPPPPEKDAEVKGLARAIREAVDAEINEPAADLASTDDAHLFGPHEFKLRAIAHRIAAKAIEQHLAGKKTATKAPR